MNSSCSACTIRTVARMRARSRRRGVRPRPDPAPDIRNCRCGRGPPCDRMAGRRLRSSRTRCARRRGRQSLLPLRTAAAVPFSFETFEIVVGHRRLRTHLLRWATVLLPPAIETMPWGSSLEVITSGNVSAVATCSQRTCPTKKGGAKSRMRCIT